MMLTSSVLQMIDRVCVKVQDHLNSLRNSETEAILEDVRSAENLIKDARNSKTVRIAKLCARARRVSLPFLHLYICPPHSCCPTFIT